MRSRSITCRYSDSLVKVFSKVEYSPSSTIADSTFLVGLLHKSRIHLARAFYSAH
eukprot:IDg20136t1